MRTVCVALTLLAFWFSSSASAQQHYTDIKGGPGGTPFSEVCPRGEYVARLEMRAGGWIDAIRAVCSRWSPYNQTLERTSDPYRPYFGGAGGDLEHLTCPRNALIGYFAVSEATNEWRSVGGLTVRCRNVLTHSGAGLPAMPSRGTWRDDIVPVGDGCPEGQAAIGIRGRAGNYLDAIGLVCAALPTQGVVPRITAAQPAFGAVALRAGFVPDPHTREILAGGNVSAATLGWGCVGWIAREPDYRVDWTRGQNALPLIISVRSSTDTTLVVHDASGNWLCDDDGGELDLNPSVRIENPASGAYEVWIGTYNRGAIQPSMLHISEVSSQ